MTESPPEDLSVDFDVVVVGAGIAGLTAARELTKVDPTIRILILEAKDRVGGRTFSTQLKGANNVQETFDLGGQWVGRTQRHILELLEQLGLETYDQFTDGAKVAQMGVAAPRKYSTTLPINSIRHFSVFEIVDNIATLAKVKWLTKMMPASDIFSWEQANRLDEMTMAKWGRENCWTRSSLDAMDIAIRAVYGTEPKRMSMMYNLVVSKSAGGFNNLLECVGDGGQAFKVKGGTQQISKKMLEMLPNGILKLSEAVTAIDVDESSLITTLRVMNVLSKKESTFTCRNVICAIPPSQCGKIEFIPELPSLKRRLFDCCPNANMIKFIITYETAFWKNAGLSGEIISTGRTITPGEVLPVVATFDATSYNGVPALVGFVNEEFADMPMGERCNAVVTDITRFFGDESYKQFLDYKDKVWSQEVYNGGCPNSFVPPGHMDAYQVIRDPFHNVHFAGTETATEWIGYMDGAAQSGKRVAHEVLHCMEKHHLVSYNTLKGTVYDNEFKPPTSPSDVYDEVRSPWWRRMFVVSAIVFGVYAYSRKYRLSYAAQAVKPVENALLKWFYDIDWPT